MSRKKQNKKRESTLAALLKEKPKRGRPPRPVSRQNVYVTLTDTQKQEMKRLAGFLPGKLNRADVPDLAISVLAARLEALRRAVADRTREIPEGITDLESLYLLWDLPLPTGEAEQKWTSLRVSPQQVIELGRAHGTLHAAFGANKSQTFVLALALLAQFLETESLGEAETLTEIRKKIFDIYL
ncbi:MAG: hypothetical protein D6706_09170 [Chloroflexi bacterium]|nr:MAG: hypothetical protein D6706_09170 [Chloroflexota bacterium]